LSSKLNRVVAHLLQTYDLIDADPGQGDSQRQRLSWYSLITDNALFVNQRGQKVAEHSLDALARLMAKGQVQVVTEDRGRLIDRAWQATLRTLRSLAGGSSAAESA
jgi:hypothetical protein